MTEIREPNYRIDLPGEWEPGISLEEGTFLYKRTDADALLTVTLLGVRPMFEIADERRLLNDYMDHRAKYEKGKIETLEQTMPSASAEEGVSIGEWSAVDPATGRYRKHHVVLVSGLLADFMYDAPATSAAVFTQEADAALSTASATAGQQ